MTGVVVVDKPRGPTSFDMVARVRRALGERRVGHTGTLDPMATGVLPICVGEATKLVPFLMAGDKGYEAEALLGVRTDSLDATGTTVEERAADHVEEGAVREALAAFVGTIAQRPPMHSAIRVGGKRLYELARAGEEIERAPRQVVVHECRLDAFQHEGSRVRIRFTVACGKGTYIRSIAGDLGDRLGVGAHLTALRRTRVGSFTLAQAISPEALEGGTATLVDLAQALAHLPAVRLDETQARDVRDGKVAAVARLSAPEDAPLVRLLRPDGTLLAVCGQATGRLQIERVFH